MGVLTKCRVRVINTNRRPFLLFLLLSDQEGTVLLSFTSVCSTKTTCEFVSNLLHSVYFKVDQMHDLVASLAISILIFFFFETGVLCVALTVLELALWTRLALLRDLPASASQVLGLTAGITTACQAWPLVIFSSKLLV